ncbi:hypothetical protein DVH05_007908 [Phytophthora capsici]|nr:hypothetical protein DVH05_007908 [Phytophthora capsici]
MPLGSEVPCPSLIVVPLARSLLVFMPYFLNSLAQLFSAIFCYLVFLPTFCSTRCPLVVWFCGHRSSYSPCQYRTSTKAPTSWMVVFLFSSSSQMERDFLPFSE